MVVEVAINNIPINHRPFEKRPIFLHPIFHYFTSGIIRNYFSNYVCNMEDDDELLGASPNDV